MPQNALSIGKVILDQKIEDSSPERRTTMRETQKTTPNDAKTCIGARLGPFPTITELLGKI